MQSKKHSTIEAMANTIIGYIIAMCLYMIVLPFFGHEINWSQSFNITAIFAVVSMARAYLIRRIFNRLKT